ncbi:MAG: lysylphosphatidylglycerol synthase transmembrane domain-containing protein, partial [Solirubrobacterales bacterium]
MDLGRSADRFADAAQTFFENFTSINWFAAAVAFLFYLGMLLARGKCWQNTLKAAYPDQEVSYARIAAAYLAGAGLNSFIPARVGDAVKIFLAKRSVRGSTYPAITSSFFVQSIFDTSVGIVVLLYAITQGLFPKPPELPNLPAFEIAFWAEHPRFLLFFLTALGIGLIVGFAILARRAENLWDRVKQGAVILTDLPRYFTEVASWQAVAWLARFASFWFFLEAFHIGGSVQNVLLVMSVQAVSTLLPFTPGGAGAQQALLVATLTGVAQATRTAVLAYSVGQQIAVAAWTAVLGFAALAFVFRT